MIDDYWRRAILIMNVTSNVTTDSLHTCFTWNISYLKMLSTRNKRHTCERYKQGLDRPAGVHE